MQISNERLKELLPTHLAGSTCFYRFGENGRIVDAYVPCREPEPVEVLQRDLEQLFPEHTAAELRSAIKAPPQAREPVCLQYSLSFSDGEHQYEAQLLSLPENQFALLAYDLSPPQEYFAGTEEVVPRLRAILDEAQEGVFQSTADGSYLFANAALAELYGYESPAELMGGITDIQKLYADPGRRKEFARLVRKNGSVTGFESPIRHREGHIIWITENARQVCNSEGELLGYEGIVVDVSERIHAQNQQRKADDELRLNSSS